MAIVYLGLGTNLGDRFANLRAAIDALEAVGRVEARSKVYETQPLYVTEQPAFLNMAVRLSTTLTPPALLAELKRLEAAIGRVASVRYGPRLIDLDILLYDDIAHDSPDLVIPHPRLTERHFALIPLADIAASIVHPIHRQTIRTLLDALPADDGVRLADEMAMRELVA
ncbi:2-amino-4-hydroxy-6-hydroxymethyldihydropteridine diphosphokinase [Magnetospirillum moscoviense]|uniref:2-amino-4-hydroxy-6-hydroxymethyldihydropteridine pyrophosphokinase n=1 Tax=Magnetospirillum moscoviense TaxID=1437059 RepID=A0A178MZI1_9PROT|nr:2-amino-4-hydroxy-6-hydroxymethyldihydropteridine diphosphokinase [Magnetospirillum moscoviense]MBF0324401.1 2-amino-4-hydroxy-6-hydroxymethyldihydropteridine diphosphokinase [Alphaproteobacteria bacterium]OAN67003.1 7,8-dihydro-6-hydroxymethylpterin-pyrophosphokinase [Magnetospirillum moscoviense]